jgi:hypothetical protein
VSEACSIGPEAGIGRSEAVATDSFLTILYGRPQLFATSAATHCGESLQAAENTRCVRVAQHLHGRWASNGTLGSEFTGLYFDPRDKRRAWVNIQHPSSANDRTIEITIPNDEE